MPSKQSRIGERYAFSPLGSASSVPSVSHRRFGAAAEKSWPPSSRRGALGRSEASDLAE